MCRKLFFLTSFVLVFALASADTVFGGIVIERRTDVENDDGEDHIAYPGEADDGAESRGSSDLEMPWEGDVGASSYQVVGIRFADIPIPKGSKVINAYIQFTADDGKITGGPVNLIINGLLQPDTVELSSGENFWTERNPKTNAEVAWSNIPDWVSFQATDASRTPDISSVIQEIIDQDDWVSGNSLMVFIRDDETNPSADQRNARSDGEGAENEPLLHIELSTKKSSSPSPTDGTLHEDTWASLEWDAGDTAVTHDVYMADNFDDVNDGAAAAFQGNYALAFLTVGFAGFPFPDGLVPGTTYYWRVDEVEADGTTTHKGDVWSFSVPSKAAYDPSPRDGGKGVDPADVTLSWTTGFGAKLHAVYFGDDFDTVSNAVGGLPQSPITFNPGALEKDKVYYWRVDELNPPETVKGNVWSFRTRPDIVITDPNMIGWWKLDAVNGNTVLDWSGYGNDGTLGGDPQLVEGVMDFGLDLDGSDYVGIDGIADDLTANIFTVSAWIRTTTTGDDDAVVASNDGASEHDFLLGVANGNLLVEADNVNEYPPVINDDQWHMITYVRDGGIAYAYTDGVLVGTEIPTMDPAGQTRWSIGQEWDDSTASDFYTGMVDDVRIFNKALTQPEVAELMRGDPLLAWNPKPGNNTMPDVEQAKTPLSWSAGDDAAEHDVYLGLDRDTVDLANTSTADIYRGRQAGTSYSPSEGLEWGSGPYFWRIDEINADGSVSTGSVWSFSVADFLSVEDFEGYTDDDQANEAIWQHWIDGYEIAGNGSQVGYLDLPYAETRAAYVHGDGQAMPLLYENTGGVANSEATLTLTGLRNWTLHDVEALSIWFRGNPASVGSFTEGPAGTFTMTGSGTDISGTADEFHFAYRMLNGTGSIIAKVNSITNTHAWAKACVMIRETLDPGSPHAIACVTPGNGVAAEARIDPSGSSFSDNETGITAPRWIKLERDIAGNFTVSHSTNGSSWQQIPGAIPNRVLMSTSAYIGLAVTSHDAGATCEAVFSNVSTTGNVTGQWTNQDIGISSNAAEPLYVSVSNATGAAAVVAHPDPAAATIDVWTEWIIPLPEFADKGINLSNIDKIAVGLGSQSGLPAAGGSGTAYFDDFRLYRTGQ